MERVWKIKTQNNTFLSIFTLTIIYAWADYAASTILTIAVTYISMGMVWKFKTYERNMYALLLPFHLLRITHIYPILCFYTLAYEQAQLKGWVKKAIAWLHETVGMAIFSFPSASERFGANSAFSSVLNIAFVAEMVDAINSIVGDLLVPPEKKVAAYYLRENGISSSPLLMAEKPTLPASEISKTVNRSQINYRIIAMIVVCAASILFFSAPLILLTFGVAIFFQNIDTKTTRIVGGTRMGPIKNGIYWISNELFGFRYDYGIGVVFNGILHIPYHVCHANEIHLGKTIYKPYTVDVYRDLVTYNGPPQFESVSEGDVIFVNCENLEARTSYLVEYDADQSGEMMAWQSVTKPGESGSPVYVLRDQQLFLAGLAGRYYRNIEGDMTEYTEIVTGKVNDENYQRHVQHPGFGKTHKVIPQIIMKHLTKMGNDARILLSGPTRPVCVELAKSLNNKGIKVGLNVKGYDSHRNEFAQVQIAAHASMIRMLMNKERSVRLATCLIIDEAHYNDASTIMLRRYGQWMLTQNLELHELSATLDGCSDNGSNYPITDLEFREGDMVKIVKKELTRGKRVMVFMPGMKNKSTLKLCEELSEYNPIRLSRETFSSTYGLLADLDRRLIVSTDISECGINIPDLDVVVDSCKKFDYFYENKVIYGKIVVTNQASAVQRRGRVGRVKPGTYYFAREPENYTEKTAAEIDAEIIMTGRDWGMGITNELDIYLSDMQFAMMVKNNKLPTQAYLLYRTNGIPKSHDERVQENTRMRNAHNAITYIGCEQNGCPCQGKWLWFDERCHGTMILGETIEMILEV